MLGMSRCLEEKEFKYLKVLFPSECKMEHEIVREKSVRCNNVMDLPRCDGEEEDEPQVTSRYTIPSLCSSSHL